MLTSPIKLVLIGVFIAIISLAIFFISFHKPEETAVVNPTLSNRINLYHYFSGDLSGGLTEMLAVVNSKDQNQQVVAHALDHEAFKSMILEALNKGQPPEIFSYWAGAKTLELAQKGLLINIDDIWKEAELDSRFTTPVSQTASTYSGHKYLLPIAQHMVVFFYNVKIFRDLDLKPPADWQELIALTEKIGKASHIPFALGARERWPAQFWFDYLLLRTAGYDYRQALMEGKARYDDPQVQRAFKIWAELLQAGWFNSDANARDWGEATRMLCSGEAAMTLMGTWAIQLLVAEQCGLKEEEGFDFFTFPIIDSGIARTAVGPVDGIVLAETAGSEAFAKSILRYFSEMESQKRFSTGSGAFAPSSEVPKEFYTPLRRRILIESEASTEWAFNYDLAAPHAIAELGMDSFNELIAFPSLWKQILTDLQASVDQSFSDSNTIEK